MSSDLENIILESSFSKSRYGLDSEIRSLPHSNCNCPDTRFTIFLALIFLSLLFFLILFLFKDRIYKWLNKKKKAFSKLGLGLGVRKYFTKADQSGLFGFNSDTVKKRPIIQKKNETECRRVFESIFGKPFPSARPQFMKRNSTGACLELDGYNEELKLAFEYNGIQHYKFSPMFHKSIDDLERQKERDTEKEGFCRMQGIKLVIIPYTVKFERLEQYIRGELRRMGYNV